MPINEILRLLKEESEKIGISVEGCESNELILIIRHLDLGTIYKLILPPIDSATKETFTEVRNIGMNFNSPTEKEELLSYISEILKAEYRSTTIEEQLAEKEQKLASQIASIAPRQIMSYQPICPICLEGVADVLIIFRAETINELEKIWPTLPALTYPKNEYPFTFPRFFINLNPSYMLNTEEWLGKVENKFTKKMDSDVAMAVILPYQREAKYIPMQELRNHWDILSITHCGGHKH